ncbi:MAG: CoA-transferase [Chloroflexota bacterium]
MVRDDFNDVLDSVFHIPDYDGTSKVIPLNEAIHRHVKPGMTLHVGRGVGAAVCELMRQFYDTDPGFTLVMSMAWDHVPNLIHCGLVKRVIASNCALHDTTPAPNPIMQRAFKDKSVVFENWTLLTHVLMHIAGAMGVGFFPTKSIIASSMANKNSDSFKIIDDPFGSGKKIGLVKAINPDVAFVHAWAADPHGNIFLPRPDAESTWGARASKGVVATVERMVSTDFLREHASMVRIPGYMVNSVSVAPFGAHPTSMANAGVTEFPAYAEDHDFLNELNRASKNRDALDAWIKHWVLDCRDHRDYLRKLGPEGLSALRGKAAPDAWEHDLAAIIDSIPISQECNATEFMVIAAAREMAEKAMQSDCRTILAGVGVSALAAWVAYYLLRQRGHDAEVMVGYGLFGYAPRPAHPAQDNFHNILTCKMLCDTFETYGVYVGSDSNSCLAAVGAGQVDKHGNTNSTEIGELFLAGSGGANDACSTAREIVVVVNQSPRRFVDRVPYITCPGHRVGTLVSSMGVFEKPGGEFMLSKYFPNPKLTGKEECIRAVRENCGWELKVSPQIQEASPPTSEELKILRLLDPRQEFTAP